MIHSTILLPINPSLQATALRMTGIEFNAFTQQARDFLERGQGEELSRLLAGNKIESPLKALDQIIAGRYLLLGEIPTIDLLKSLEIYTRYPMLRNHNYGDLLHSPAYPSNFNVDDITPYSPPLGRDSISNDFCSTNLTGLPPLPLSCGVDPEMNGPMGQHDSGEKKGT